VVAAVTMKYIEETSDHSSYALQPHPFLECTGSICVVVALTIACVGAKCMDRTCSFNTRYSNSCDHTPIGICKVCDHSCDYTVYWRDQ